MFSSYEAIFARGGVHVGRFYLRGEAIYVNLAR